MDNLIDFSYASYARFIQEDQIFSHTHIHLYYIFQFVINIAQINNTISTGQLTAIQCIIQ